MADDEPTSVALEARSTGDGAWEVAPIRPPARTKARKAQGKPRHPSIPLVRLEDVRREMASLYRMARAGQLDTAEMTKLIFCLSAIGRLLLAEREALGGDGPRIVKIVHETTPARPVEPHDE